MTGMTSHDAARAWLATDPDPITRAELKELLEAAGAGDPEAARTLEDAFSGPLTFGTAGLRGRMGAGPHRMNLVVFAQATAGLADWLRDNGHAEGRVMVRRQYSSAGEVSVPPPSWAPKMTSTGSARASVRSAMSVE